MSRSKHPDTQHLPAHGAGRHSSDSGQIDMPDVRYARPVIGVLAFALLLGCGLVTAVDNPAALNGPLYWAAETDTPVPTVTRLLGYTTPVFAATPVPGVLTTTPQWALVTVTPSPTPPTYTTTPTPWWQTPTVVWVTTTPAYITTTPVPPVTTTPGLPQIGFTTPRPLATPYYRIGSFYMHSDVYVGGPDGLVLRLVDHSTQPDPARAAATLHYLRFEVRNGSDTAVMLPLSDLVFVRHVVSADGQVVTGRWLPTNAPLNARGLPSYETQQLAALEPGEQRDIVLGFSLPAGRVDEVGLVTEWQQPVAGGVPVWFYLRHDPQGPFEDADRPPPPTPRVIGSGQSGAGTTPVAPGTPGAPPAGGGMWPTTGTLTRGFGCHAFYTGIDGAGYGCPAERPWFHNGVDIANSTGTAVWSPVDGEITYAGPNASGPDCSDIAGSQPPHAGLGNYQKIQGRQTLHYFGHLSSFTQTAGSVVAGQTTAGMGSTGCSTGTHLHWIVYENGALVDPAQWAGAGP